MNHHAHPWRVARLAAAAAAATAAATAVFAPPAAAEGIPHYVLAVAKLDGNDCYPGVHLYNLDEGGATLGNSAAASVNATSPMGCESSVSWDGFANAQADLSSGSLHAVSYAATPMRDNGASVIATHARAMFMDSITVKGYGEGWVRMGLHLDGMARSTGMGVFSMGVCFGATLGDGDPLHSAECRTIDNFDQGNSVVGVPTTRDIDLLMTTVLPASPEAEINLYAELFVTTWDGWYGGTSVLDLGHTAQLSIELAEGLTFTSESGVLLTQPPAVPEPASALLCLAGLAGLAARRRGCAGPGAGLRHG